MSIRASDLPFDAVHAPVEALALKRAVLWALLASKVLAGWGVQWDIQWHVHDRPRLVLDPAASHDLCRRQRGRHPLLRHARSSRRWRGTGAVRVLGLSGSRGFHLAAWGIAVTILAAPIDDLWHRLFGIDVTLWSPPHLMGILGSRDQWLGLPHHRARSLP